MENLLACQQIKRTHIACLVVFSHVIIALRMECQYMRNTKESVRLTWNANICEI
jgi:hypothetical protein